jgi:ubiquitin carboxyl-terminal hydrolase 7
LQIHLCRFELDWNTERNTTVNDRFEFRTEIDLEPYFAADADRSKPDVSELYGVLIHAGDVGGGHYYAFLRTTTVPQWYQFNDSSVSLDD